MVSKIVVEVAYVDPELEFLKTLEVASGTTAEGAVQVSGLLEEKPDLVLDKLGVFGKTVALSHVLKNHDRVEVYRPLIFDPKEARRKRAAQKSK